jgi:hypothetical protein
MERPLHKLIFRVGGVSIGLLAWSFLSNLNTEATDEVPIEPDQKDNNYILPESPPAVPNLKPSPTRSL